MKLTKAIKVRLYPNKTQEKQINITLGHCRYIYNHMLDRQTKIYARRKEHMSAIDMQNLLPIIKMYKTWLKDADSQALKYACRQLDNAYQKMFKESAGKPKYKTRKGRQSYTTTKGESIHIDYDLRKIKIPLLGWVKCKGLRRLPDDTIIKRATISKEPDGKYYCSIAYTYEANIVLDMPDNPIAIGLDYKVSGLYVDSDGNTGGKPKYFAEAMDKLQREQYKLSTKKGSKRHETKSKRYLKQMHKVNKVHKHIRNQRYDFLHKQSLAIAKQYDVVCIEDISIKDMYVRYEELDNHKAEHSINHTIADDGWYTFTQVLNYKLKDRGKRLLKVDKAYPSSEICSCCGSRKIMPLGVNIYECPLCGVSINRDYNAAINIKNEGMRLLSA